MPAKHRIRRRARQPVRRYTRKRSRWVMVLLALAVGRTALAGPLDALNGLERGDSVSVAAALDGETLRLADGRELRLAAIEVPVPDLPRGGRARDDQAADTALAALADEARRALAGIAVQR